MMGSLTDDNTKGVIPRLCDNLFDRISEVRHTHTLLTTCVRMVFRLQKQASTPQITFKVAVSYMEIYCEKVKDLLSPKGYGGYYHRVCAITGAWLTI